VLETFGAGNTTTEQWFIDALKATIKRGVPVVNVTQCISGSVHMGNYETSVALKKMGVINGGDITSEAAIAKMMYLLGQNLGPKVFKTVFETSLRGEMS
jgi:L-asparaginase